MLNRRCFGVLILASILSVGMLAQAEAAKGPGRGGRNKAGKVEGTLVAVAEGSVSIRTRNGAVVSLFVNAQTKIEHNDVHVPLAALRVGDRAQAIYDPVTLIASKVETNS